MRVMGVYNQHMVFGMSLVAPWWCRASSPGMCLAVNLETSWNIYLKNGENKNHQEPKTNEKAYPCTPMARKN